MSSDDKVFAERLLEPPVRETLTTKAFIGHSGGDQPGKPEWHLL